MATGWNVVTKHCISGLALVYGITKWHEPENIAAEELAHEKCLRLIDPHLELQPGELCVESADNAFHRHAYRRKAMKARIVQNIHLG